MLQKLFAALLTVVLCLGTVSAQVFPSETAAPAETPINNAAQADPAPEAPAPAVQTAKEEEKTQPVALPEEPPVPATDPAPATEPAPTEAAPPVEEPAPTEAPAPEKVLLTADEAKAIALADAKLTAEQVTKLRAEKDKDDGTVHWDVEFRSGDWEYDYSIHAETGKILERDKEYDPPEVKETVPQETSAPVEEPAPTETTPPVEEPAPTEAPAPEKTLLTAAEAKAIALEHAKLTAEQVTKLRAEKDEDDGVIHWDVEFRSNDWEYDYSIHAETGKILERDKEYDPPKVKETAPKETTAPVEEPAPTEAPAPEKTLLTAEEAKAAALADAKLTADQVTKLRAEKDEDDGVIHWDVEFHSNDWEYDCSIHAETGKVLERDKEYDPPEVKETVPQEEPAPEKAQLTAEEAKAAALAHAKLTADQVTKLRAEKDEDDGVTYFEVTFKYDRFEYEYELNAETGAVLNWEKDD